ncbi:MAG: hypothetical protein ACXWAV_06605 [Chthoniobacterales bacterium]
MNSNFFSELKRRGVFKVALAYAILGWLFIEVVFTLISLWQMPNELAKFVALVVAVGFPVALLISWKFEMTPAGMKRTHELSPNEFIPYWSRKKFAAFMFGAGLLAAALTIYQWMRR